MGYDESVRGNSEPSPGTHTVVPAPDPAPVESGGDRLGVHVVWELLLLVAAAGVAYLLWRENPDTLRGDDLRSLLVDGAVLGLLALAAGLSLRTAAVNLAIGPAAVAAALHMAEQGDRGAVAALGPAIAAGVLGGLLLAFVVTVLHVPAWAASLAAGAALVAYIERRGDPVLPQGSYDPTSDALYLFAGFAALAVLGGLFGALRPIRRLAGRFRPVSDPARRPGVLAPVVAGGALVASSVLAVLAGSLLGTPAAGPVAVGSGLDWTVLAVGTALLAGTSAFGRRGGILGTLLAVSLVTLVLTDLRASGLSASRWAVGAVVLGVGLVVTRLVEAYGGARDDREAVADGPDLDEQLPADWNVRRPEPLTDWTATLPPQPAESPTDQWELPDWGSGRHWDPSRR
ncbi:ABC transporter permease [Salinispora cortesiana]|uniref:ABC transporter permease n=1 Tax=Salinispora cortesiana TaxID=1305843 RepID=UPI000418C7D3|nr:ABC transporter permease [Salinispora cortesiana]